MKRLVKDESKCVGCGACEKACAMAYYKTEDPAYSCIRVDNNPDGTNTLHICNQCGQCAEVCITCVIKANALGVYMLNKKECAGCLMCVGYCPENVMVYSSDRNEPSKCTACGICVRVCPSGAIMIVED